MNTHLAKLLTLTHNINLLPVMQHKIEADLKRHEREGLCQRNEAELCNLLRDTERNARLLATACDDLRKHVEGGE